MSNDTGSLRALLGLYVPEHKLKYDDRARALRFLLRTSTTKNIHGNEFAEDGLEDRFERKKTAL